MRTPLSVLAVASALLLAGCGDDDEDGAVTQAATEAEGAVQEAEEQVSGVDTSAVADQLRAQGLNTLASAIETVGIENIIQGQTFTLFAPQDDAWLGLSTDDLSNLLADPDQATELLRSHVSGERLLAADLAEMGEVSTASGRTLSIEGSGEGVTIDGATVVEPDIEAGGGVIHVVDAILASDIIQAGA